MHDIIHNNESYRMLCNCHVLDTLLMLYNLITQQPCDANEDTEFILQLRILRLSEDEHCA